MSAESRKMIVDDADMKDNVNYVRYSDYAALDAELKSANSAIDIVLEDVNSDWGTDASAWTSCDIYLNDHRNRYPKAAK
jgi:hypothetical protein